MKFSMLFLSFLSLSAFGATAFVDGKYTIDPAHTRVGFEVGHFVISKVAGRFNEVSGKLDVSKDLKKCNLVVTIPTASIDTNNAKRDEHLKGPDFFEVKKYPNMVFKSKKCTGTLEDLKVVGDLTIKDITKEVVMDVEYEGSVKDPWGAQRAAFKGEFDIKRQDFNVRYNELMEIGPQVGDKVEVDIIAELTLDQPKKK